MFKSLELIPDEASASVLNLVSGIARPIDLTRVRTQSGRTYYSFLSIGWGFLADCDIESERLRQGLQLLKDLLTDGKVPLCP